MENTNNLYAEMWTTEPNNTNKEESNEITPYSTLMHIHIQSRLCLL